MKLEITNAQLNAIVDLCTDIEAMLGTSEEEHYQKDYDVEAKKKLKLIKKCLLNNGYQNPFNSIK